MDHRARGPCHNRNSGPPTGSCRAVLTIDSSAIQENWRTAQRPRPRPAECGAAVKGNAYGLGVEPVARPCGRRAAAASSWPGRWKAASCAPFCRARPSSMCSTACFPARPSSMPAKNLRPALIIHRGGARMGGLRNRLWPEASLRHSCRYRHQPARLFHPPISTRLLGDNEIDGAASTHPADEPSRLRRRSRAIRSTLEAARDLRERPRSRLPGVPASLANSSGIFLGSGYAHDLVRPGIALYGGNPIASQPNPMLPVAISGHRPADSATSQAGETRRLWRHLAGDARNPHRRPGRRLQGRRAARLEFARHATGPPRSILGGRRCPIIGRVSMDMMAIDVTGCAAPIFAARRHEPNSSAPTLPSTKRQDGPAPSPTNCSPVWASASRRLYSGGEFDSLRAAQL